MKLAVKDLANKEVGSIELDAAVFGVTVRDDILHTMVNYQLAKRRAEQDKLGWKPALPRPRKVSAALKAYAKLATSADKGAVRDLSLLD